MLSCLEYQSTRAARKVKQQRLTSQSELLTDRGIPVCKTSLMKYTRQFHLYQMSCFVQPTFTNLKH